MEFEKFILNQGSVVGQSIGDHQVIHAEYHSTTDSTEVNVNKSISTLDDYKTIATQFLELLNEQHMSITYADGTRCRVSEDAHVKKIAQIIRESIIG